MREQRAEDHRRQRHDDAGTQQHQSVLLNGHNRGGAVGQANGGDESAEPEIAQRLLRGGRIGADRGERERSQPHTSPAMIAPPAPPSVSGTDPAMNVIRPIRKPAAMPPAKKAMSVRSLARMTCPTDSRDLLDVLGDANQRHDVADVDARCRRERHLLATPGELAAGTRRAPGRRSVRRSPQATGRATTTRSRKHRAPARPPRRAGSGPSISSPITAAAANDHGRRARQQDLVAFFSFGARRDQRLPPLREMRSMTVRRPIACSISLTARPAAVDTR